MTKFHNFFTFLWTAILRGNFGPRAVCCNNGDFVTRVQLRRKLLTAAAGELRFKYGRENERATKLLSTTSEECCTRATHANAGMSCCVQSLYTACLMTCTLTAGWVGAWRWLSITTTSLSATCWKLGITTCLQQAAIKSLTCCSTRLSISTCRSEKSCRKRIDNESHSSDYSVTSWKLLQLVGDKFQTLAQWVYTASFWQVSE